MTVTPRESAAILGIRLDSVYSLIWAGRLAAEKRDGRWLVDKAALDARVQFKAIGKGTCDSSVAPLEANVNRLERSRRGV